MAFKNSELKLFPFQVEGSKWLASKKYALLADEMGLGKSAQAINAADQIDAAKILILCPAVARENWIREFKKFSRVNRQYISLQTKRDQIGQEVNICSYDLIPNLNSQFKSIDLLILDEAHYLKSISAKRTKAVLGSNGLIHKCKRAWALTGTPTPNHPGELWPLLYTFGWTQLKYPEFLRLFCTYYKHSWGIQVTGAQIKNIPRLKNILAPVMLRRKKEEVMKDLPPIFFSHVVVEAGKVDLDIQTSFIQYLTSVNRTQDLMDKIEKENQVLKNFHDTISTNSQFMNALKILAPSISTLRKYNGLQKVDPVSEMVSEELIFGAYEKIIIFAIHKDVIDRLREKLRLFKPVILYGGTPREKRERRIQRFQEDPKCRVFIGNIAACGTAITLNAAHNVLFIEQDWVPGNNAQASMRCHRIGQKNPVSVRFVGLANSMDEKISQVLKRKTEEISKIFDSDPLQTTREEITFD